MTIKRWNLCQPKTGIQPHPDGQLVEYDDHAAEVEALKAQNAKLREALAEASVHSYPIIDSDERMFLCDQCYSQTRGKIVHAPSCLLH